MSSTPLDSTQAAPPTQIRGPSLISAVSISAVGALVLIIILMAASYSSARASQARSAAEKIACALTGDADAAIKSGDLAGGIALASAAARVLEKNGIALDACVTPSGKTCILLARDAKYAAVTAIATATTTRKPAVEDALPPRDDIIGELPPLQKTQLSAVTRTEESRKTSSGVGTQQHNNTYKRTPRGGSRRSMLSSLTPPVQVVDQQPQPSACDVAEALKEAEESERQALWWIPAARNL